MKNRYCCTCSGFTLVELLIVITLIGLIATFAIPSMDKLLSKSHRHSAVSDMVTLINLTRNTAIMEQRTVTMCPLGQTNRCIDHWNTLPITVFRDPDANRELAHEDDIVRVKNLANGGTWKANNANRSYFRFFSSGMASYAIGNMIWCPENGDSFVAAQVVINMGGRPRLSEDRNGDGMLEDANGNTVVCN